jgi:tRNA (cmo5U34)-methyltransferase
VSQYHFDPSTYDEVMREIPGFAELQRQVAAAAEGLEVARMLELGTGTGVTAAHVRAVHPDAHLVGVDESTEMLAEARLENAELLVRRIEDPLPEGPFDLVFSALAVHHLDAAGKRDLFERVAHVLRPEGRFVLGDVVVPEQTEDAVTPITPGFDLPERVPDLLAWLMDAGFYAQVAWEHRDLAVLIGLRHGDEDG